MQENTGPNNKIRVLVTDDHAMFAQGVVRSLQEHDDIVVVGTAGSVEESVAAARMHKPDVVLMDYELPDGTGVDAAERIKTELPETKVVMVTSYTDETVLVRAIEAGCSGYVTKHKVIEEVVSAVRAAAAGEALISPAMLARLLPKLRPTKRGVGADLTSREIEVLTLLAEGLANQSIADKLVISVHTVRHHVQNIITKLQAHSKLEAVATAAREGIIRYP
jgi:DNA-binding NarL/FixJ family response regulator